MGFGLASSDDQINPKVLPRRLMEDEIAERFNKLGSADFQAAFDKAGAQWLEPRLPSLAIRLSVPRRHRARAGKPAPRPSRLRASPARAPTWPPACSWSMDAREGSSEPGGAKVRAQLDQLADLICRGGAAAPHAAGELHAADVYRRQHLDQRAEGHQALVPAGGAQAADRRGADVDRRQRCRLRRARGLFHDRQRCATSRRSQLSSAARCASARRCRASISTCSTSA